MEALIACMAAAGLPANRPPHIFAPARFAASWEGLDLGSDIGSGDNSPVKSARPKSWMGAAMALAGVLYVVFLGASKPQGEYRRFAQGAMAKLEIMADAPVQPEAAFRDAAGQPVGLSAYRGKVVVMNLWATWCAPCREEMP